MSKAGRSRGVDSLARAAARRLRRAAPTYRSVPEKVVADAFQRVLEAALEVAGGAASGTLERELDRLADTFAERGFTVGDALLGARETERALRTLLGADEGGQALGSERWTAVALQAAEEHFLTRLAAVLERRREADERRFAAVLEALPDMVVFADETQRIRYANGRVRDILGLDAAEVVGRTFNDLVALGVPERFADPEAFLAGARRMMATPDRAHEDEVRLGDGRVVLRRSLPLGEGGRVAIYSDITRLCEDEARMKALLRQVIDAQERERKRIASELHDGPVQVLSATLLRLDALHSRVASEGGEALGHLRRALEETRSLLFNLRPEILEREGLAAAVRSLLDLLVAETGIETRLEVEVTERPPRELELLAFRVLQEAVTNVRKHAAARSLVVRIAGAPGLDVEVRDDGVGFDPAAAEGSPAIGHVGLASMRERVELAGGTFAVASAPGEGTSIRFSFPAPRR